MRLAPVRRRRAGLAALSALTALVASLIAATAAPADVTVKATFDRAQVAVGEDADLGVEVQGVQSSAVPEIANAGGAAVRYLGPSSRVSFVNGAMSASVTHHFSVRASTAGRVTLGPITVAVNGKSYGAGTATLDVVAGSPGRRRRRRQSGRQPAPARAFGAAHHRLRPRTAPDPCEADGRPDPRERRAVSDRRR